MSSYTLRFSDPNTSSTITVLGTDVSTGKNNYDTSLDLIGPGYINFGQSYAQNFVRLLENFASPYPPLNSLKGQLWYDTSNPDRYTLRVNNGSLTSSRWPSASGIYQQSIDPYVEFPGNIKEGDIWVDTSVNQLKIRYATGWTLVGPTNQLGDNKFGNEAVVVESNTGTNYPVILNWIDGKVVEILSYHSFIPRSVIEGFTTIKVGSNLTLKKSAKYNGIADRASSLELANGSIIQANEVLKNRATSQTHTGTFIVEAGNGFQVKSLTSNEVLKSYLTLSGNILKANINFTNTATNSTFKVGIQDNAYLLFNANGKIGLNTLTPSYNLDINGTGRFNGVLTISSSSAVALAVSGGASFGGSLTFAGASITGITTATNKLVIGDVTGSYTSGPIIDTTVFTATQGVYDIGTTSTPFRHVYANTIGFAGFTTTVYGNVLGTSSKLASNRNFRVQGQVLSDVIQFDGSSDVLMTATLTAQSISSQSPTETPEDTHTLLVLNTSTSASGDLEKISKKSFLSDVYPYLIPTGAIMPYGNSTAPAGFLLCNGLDHDQASYPDLYAVLGTTYGSGSPGAFKVPLFTGSDDNSVPLYYIIKT